MVKTAAPSVVERRHIAVMVNHLHEGHIFTVRFVKRSTGEVRVMNCRKGVRKYLKGGPMAYNPDDKGLLWVFDVQHSAYRSIAIEGILSLTMDGVTYTPKD